MRTKADLVFDSAMVIDPGRRERQEDAVASDFPSGEPFGFVVLADGMGGHAAGDVASKIVVTEVFSELKLQSGDPAQLEARMREVLKGAALNANTCISLYAREHPNAHGMGATLLALVMVEDRLYWISVGDSPLYLFRNGKLTRLNENHALASQIEFLVSSGVMSRTDAIEYPDQCCLTSVLIGGEIAQIDCPAAPFAIMEGDILIAASDGLQFISEEQIERLLRFQRNKSSEEISATLVQEIKKLDDPAQDNLSLCVIKAMREGTMANSRDMNEPQPRPKEGKAEAVTILARIRRSRKAVGQG